MRETQPTRQRWVGFLVAISFSVLSGLVPLIGCTKPPSKQQQATSGAKTAAELFDAGQTAQALAALAATCDPTTDTECTRRIAQAWETLGEPEQALAVLIAPKTQDTSILANQLTLSLRMGDFANAAAIARKTAATGQLTAPILDDVGLALAFTDPISMDASLARMPTSPQVVRLRGISALVAGNPKAAASWLTQATANPETDAKTFYLLGVARRASKDLTGAKKAFEQAVAAKDSSLDAAIALGANDSAALAMLDAKKSAVREHPGYWRVVAKDRMANGQSTAAGIAKGYAAFYDGLPIDAEQTWASILVKATGSDRREIFAALFNSAYKRQDSPLAQKWVDRALLEFPDDMWFRKRRAEVLVQQNRLKDAIKQIETISTADTPGQGTVSQAELSDLKCRVLLDSGDVSGFQAGIDAYIKDAPDSEFPYLMRGEAILAAGRQPANLKDALAAYTTATTKAPTDPEAWASRGALEAELGQKDAASASLYQALSLWPRVQDGTPHLKLISLLNTADPAGLRAFHTAEYKRLRALKDGWPTALKLLRVAGTGTGQQWLDFGKLALDRHENWIALCAFQQSVKMLPNDPAGYRGLAAARWRSGWFIAALYATLRANKLDGKNKR